MLPYATRHPEGPRFFIAGRGILWGLLNVSFSTPRAKPKADLLGLNRYSRVLRSNPDSPSRNETYFKKTTAQPPCYQPRVVASDVPLTRHDSAHYSHRKSSRLRRRVAGSNGRAGASSRNPAGRRLPITSS